MNSFAEVCRSAKLRHLVLSAVLAGAFAGQVSSAAAHEQTTRSDYYWLGWSHKDDGNPPGAGNRKDPLNFIFLGGGVWTNALAKQHLRDDWSRGSMGDHICKSTQRAYWRDNAGRRATSDKQDWQLSAVSFLPGIELCYQQYHIRGWDDLEHSRVTTGHSDSWIIADLHHERLIPKFPCCFTHKINRDWDRVRLEGVKAMAAHCSYRHWRYDPAQHLTWQGYSNYGYVARVSLRHAANGCSGA